MSEVEFPAAQYFPWQASQRSRLLRQIDENRLPHALLLTGVSDTGKKEFAFALASQLLCKQPDGGQACNSCSVCHLLQARSHPDLKIVRPEESKLIVVGQIRNLIDWSNQTSLLGGAKVAILYPAEQMNVQSANALLKCLEEPGAESFFLLVTDQPGRLLPTIRSRCQKVDFPLPRKEDTIEWLQANTEPGVDIPLLLTLALGAPMKVVNQFDVEFLARRSGIASCIEEMLLDALSPIDAAAKILNKQYLLEIYDLLYSILSDALRRKLVGSKYILINKDLDGIVNVICSKYRSPAILKMLEMVSVCRVTVTGSSNPNPQLLLESLLIKLHESGLAWQPGSLG